MVKIGTPFAESGSMNAKSTPVNENGNGPSSLKQLQRSGEGTSAGRFSLRHTIDNSSAVRVIEVNSPFVAHSGTAASAASRTIA